jgi:hypothetical protein
VSLTEIVMAFGLVGAVVLGGLVALAGDWAWNRITRKGGR